MLFVLSTALFFYGGKPFFTGARDELKDKKPAMMMLITLAITIAYGYSTLTVFGLGGMDFFWELATLIVVMLLGHWIEMKSVMGASKALEELVALMPEVAHRLWMRWWENNLKRIWWTLCVSFYKIERLRGPLI